MSMHQATMPGLDGPGVRLACPGQPKGPPLTWRSVGKPCANAYFKENFEAIQARDGFASSWTLLLGLLLLVPARWGRRSVLASVVTVGGPLAALAYSMCFIQVWDRYLTWLAVPLGVLVPAGLARVFEWIPRLPGRSFLAAVGAFAWALYLWPGRGAPLLPPPLPDMRAQVREWAWNHLQPEDRVLDCGFAFARQLLLPRHFEISAASPEAPACQAWITASAAGPGDRYLVVPEDPRKWGLARSAMQAAGWEAESLPASPPTTEGRVVYRQVRSR